MISNRCHYALLAVLELSLRAQQGPISIGQIAEARGIPARFLEAILRDLKQAGVVTSARGKEGGYQLARAPHAIAMGEVIRIFEGPLVAEPKAAANLPDGELPDVFAAVWREAGAALGEVYDRVDFGALSDREAQRVAALATNYSI
jgi:Rrf2 family protein